MFHTHPTRRVFTLVDLLVVIAVLAVLAALLFPVFAQAREKARDNGCISGARQFSRGLAVYAQDYDDLTLRTPGAMLPYIKTGQYRCPASAEVGAPSFLLTRENARRDFAGGGRGHSANMFWHNGSILTSAFTQAIFWGPRWSNSGFAGDKITGLDDWYNGHGGSNYSKT